MATAKKRKKTPLVSSKTMTNDKSGKLNTPAGIPETGLANPVQPVGDKIPVPKSGPGEQKVIEVPFTQKDSKAGKDGKKTEKKKKSNKKKIKSDLKSAKNKQKKIKMALKKAKSGKAGKKKIKKLKAKFAKISRKVKKIKKG